MLKNLKRKFLIAATIALTVVIGVLMTAINIMNHHSVIADADEMLRIIMTATERLPANPDEIPDIPDDTRCFAVFFIEGEIDEIDRGSITSFNEEKARDMADSVKLEDGNRGFREGYRYLVRVRGRQSRVVFLDCRKALDSAWTFMALSLTISLMGIISIFSLLWILSDKIVQPLLESHEKQKQFITDAGHDIKTPITIIEADAELLEMEIGENDWLTDIRKQAARLATLTSDLIYLSRMEEQALKPHADFPISEVVEEVVSSFTAPAKTKNIIIEDSITPAVYYCGEEEAIRKLITLLMDNAVKYSPENEVVTASLKKLPRGVLIRIANKAPNITEEDIGRIFDRFYRSDPARSSNGGFGIGLSVASAIVASHKGKISAQKQDNTLVIEVIL